MDDDNNKPVLNPRIIEALNELYRDPITSQWFGSPVDPVALQIPDYFDIVKVPMDLGTVKSRIDSDHYKNDDECIHEIRLTFLNAMRYNPQANAVHKAAKRLLRKFDRFMAPRKGNSRKRTANGAARGSSQRAKKRSTFNGASKQVHAHDPPFKPACLRVLEAIINHDCSGPFLKPVDPVRDEIPDYLKVISYPMDLSTVKKKLTANLFPTPKEFADDVRVIWSNCISYNGSDKGVSRMARQLGQKFERLFLREFPAYAEDSTPSSQPAEPGNASVV